MIKFIKDKIAKYKKSQAIVSKTMSYVKVLDLLDEALLISIKEGNLELSKQLHSVIKTAELYSNYFPDSNNNKTV